MNISSRQYIVLDYIKRFIAEKNYSPTIREIMDGLALKSPSTVHDHLKRLASLGLITFKENKSRTIELLVENEYLKDTIVKLPIFNEDEFLDIPVFMIGNEKIDDLFVYKNGNEIYVIDKNVTNGKYKMYKFNGEYSVQEQSSGEFIGSVISKFIKY